MKIPYRIFALFLVAIAFSIARADVNEQINKTVPLAGGANVRVSGINGRVTLETADINQAEINIAIKASSREALEQRPIVIENTPSSLVIRTINDREGGRESWNRGWVRHEVHVRMPRNVSLKVNGVNGPVQVGEITGEIAINGINGRVEVAQAGTASDIGGINGQTTISILNLGERGLHVKGINGHVEIGVPAGLNANIDVTGVNGNVNSDLPMQVIGEMRRGQLKGTIGSGGVPIQISGVNGGIHLKRN